MFFKKGNGEPQAITKVASDAGGELQGSEAASRALLTNFFRGNVWSKRGLYDRECGRSQLMTYHWIRQKSRKSRRHLPGLDRGVGINVLPEGGLCRSALRYGPSHSRQLLILLIVGTLDEVAQEGLSRTFGPCNQSLDSIPWKCVPENRRALFQFSAKWARIFWLARGI